MFTCYIIKNNSFSYLSYINCINYFKTKLMVKGVRQRKQLQTIFRNIKKYSFTNHDLNMLYFKNLSLPVMDDVTELAELAQEQEIGEKYQNIVADVSDNFSKQENEPMDQEILYGVDIEKVPHKEGQYQHSFNINRYHYKHIVGVKGTLLQKLCSETDTIIKISRKKKHVVITGSVQKRIVHAKQKIENLIQNSKNKLSFTHFISIPTNISDVQQHFFKFKEDVLKNCDKETTGFHEDMFQKPEKLHLTICMLHLLENSDQRKAIKALNICKKEIIDPILQENGPLTMEFKGLECMEKNTTKVKVIYAKVQEETGLLQKISDQISEYFVQQGLSRKQYDNVTLHMTLINTFYLKKKKHKIMKKSFNATQILKDYENTYFGKMNLSTFHLSQLTAKSDDGYFEATSKIEF